MHPNTPRPPNPEPPSPSESTGSLQYVPKSPMPEQDEMEVPPPGPGIQLHVPEPTILPQLADYTSGAPRGPHHQPAPFDDCGLPQHPFVTRKVQSFRETNRENEPAPLTKWCYYCNVFRHWNALCPRPHSTCTVSGWCIAPPTHRNFR